MRLWRIGTLSWRAGQIYLALVVVAAVAAAAWTTRYWTRGRSYFGEALPRVSRALPAVARERVEKSPVEGSAETAALALWVFGPLALPAVGVVAGLLLVGVRRRRRAALVVALLIAAAALPVAYGGGRALRTLEDRHYYARSPYVRTYRALAIPLAAASGGLLLLVAVDGLLRARRRPDD